MFFSEVKGNGKKVGCHYMSVKLFALTKFQMLLKMGGFEGNLSC